MEASTGTASTSSQPSTEARRQRVPGDGAARRAARAMGTEIGRSERRRRGIARPGPERAIKVTSDVLEERGYEPYRDEWGCVRLRNIAVPHTAVRRVADSPDRESLATLEPMASDRSESLSRMAEERSELPVGTHVDKSSVAVTGYFEVGEDASRRIDLLGRDATARLDEADLAEPVTHEAGTTWQAVSIDGVEVFAGGLFTRGRGGVVHELVLRLTSHKEWLRPRSEPDPTAAIDLVRKTRALPEDLEDPEVPDPSLVWFDPSLVFADNTDPAEQAWRFSFTGDRPGDVVVSLDGTRVLAVIARGDVDNAYTHVSTPRYVLDPVTGVPRFVTFHPALLLPQASTKSATNVASAFFQTFRSMFGTGDATAQLQLNRVERDLDGAHHVVFDQFHGGVPVWGCQLIVHLDDSFAITSISGRFFRDPDVELEPRLPEAMASTFAMNDWTRGGDDTLPEGERIESRGLVILPWRLARPHEQNHLAWWFRYPDHDRFVSAHTGAVIARLPRVRSVRRIYDANNARPGESGELQLEDGVQRSTALDQEAQGADNATAAAEAFWRLFGRNGWNNAGADSDVYVDVNFDDPMTQNLVEQNASWNGSRSSYSRNFAEADVVGHEFMHAINDATASLVYLFESGALDESFADVFGKLIAPTPQQWVIGAGSGINRNLQNPTVNNYGTFLVVGQGTDNGGVHTNSGIGNRAAVLVSDGDPTRAGLGRDRLARIWWDTLTTRLSSWSTYVDLLANAWQVTLEMVAGGRSGVLLPGAAAQANAFTAGDPRHVLWAFQQVGLRMDLLSGWFTVPGNATTDFVFFEGLTTAANETVSDVIVRIERVRGDRTTAFLGVLQVSTSTTTATFAGGSVTATITQHGVGGSSREVRVRVTTQNFSDVEVSAQVLTQTQPGTQVPPPNLPYPTQAVAHWFDNPFFLGRRYGDIVFEAVNLSVGTVTDVVLELLSPNNTVLASTRLGQPAAVNGARGAWIFSRQIGGSGIEVRVRSWHDFGWAVRYRLVYWVTGDQVTLPAFALREVGPDNL
jgi:Zn-dependent metalloprotease